MKNNFWLMLVALVGSLALITSACGDSEEETACTDEGGVYECFDDATGDLCEDTEDPECTCECTIDANNTNNPNNTNNNTCTTDADCAGDLVCLESGMCGTVSGPSYRFVMIEDLQDPVSGEFPGADIDSVELVKGGVPIGAVDVEDFENLTLNGNNAANPNEVLGAPDANCDAQSGRFYAMGGLGSWMVLSYGTETIEEGDAIDVVELGNTECGTFDDDDYAIGIGISAEATDNFFEIRECTGSCTAVVPAL